MGYTANVPAWSEGAAPGISAARLNHLETQYTEAAADDTTHNANVTDSHGRVAGVLPIGQMAVATRQKTGTFVNDTANGAQTISGVGFAPTYVIVSTEEAGKSISFFDGTRDTAIIMFGGVLQLNSGSQTLQAYTGVGDFITGRFGGLTADGFTIIWSGLTGTAPARTYFYIAFG